MKKLIATSLVINLLGSNIALAYEKPLPPLPKALPDNAAVVKKKVVPVEEYIPVSHSSEKTEDSLMVQPESRYIKSGEDLTVSLLNPINSLTARPEDRIRAKLLLPIDLNGKIVIPEGSIVTGKIVQLKKATKAGKNALVKVHFDYIEVNKNYRIPISGKLKTMDRTGVLTGGNYKKQLEKNIAMGATTTAGGALTGLGLGLLSSAAAVGSVVGLIIGGVLGFGWLFFKKGKSVNIPDGTNLLINLEYDVAITDIGL